MQAKSEPVPIFPAFTTSRIQFLLKFVLLAALPIFSFLAKVEGTPTFVIQAAIRFSAIKV